MIVTPTFWLNTPRSLVIIWNLFIIINNKIKIVVNDSNKIKIDRVKFQKENN